MYQRTELMDDESWALAEQIIRRVERGDPIDADKAADLAHEYIELYRKLNSCIDKLDAVKYIMRSA